MKKSGHAFALEKRRIIAELIRIEDFENEEDAEQAALDWSMYDVRHLKRILQYNREHVDLEEEVNA